MSTTSSKNFTTLYSGSGSVTPQAPYGNANVVGLLAASTDGANTIGNISATGNVSASFFLGDGSQLTNLPGGDYGNANVAAFLPTYTGNLTANTISATGNIVTAGFFVGNFSGNISGNIVVPGLNTQVLFNNNGNAGASADFTFNDATNVMSVAGNIVATNIAGSGTALSNITGANVTGVVAQATQAATANIAAVANSVAGANVTGVVAQATQAATANVANSVAGANVTGVVAQATQAATANVANSVAGANVTGVVAQATQAATANVANSVAGANVTGVVAQATQANAANTAVTVTGAAQANITSVGTLTSLSASGNITSSGNVSGNFILGNGSQLTGLPATYGNANVAANLAAFGSNPILTTGNVTAGNFIGNGQYLTNINAGNITGSYGNANVAAFMAAFGSNTITTTGNVTAGFFIGDGSQLTNLPAGTYGNANVTSLLAAFGSNTISTTGNISGGNLLLSGAQYVSGSILGAPGSYAGIFGRYFGNSATASYVAAGLTAANQVDIKADTQEWFFGSNGNLTLPSNTAAINYANGVNILSGVTTTYGNANVAAYLPTFTGNIGTTGGVNTILVSQINASEIDVGAWVISQASNSIVGNGAISTTGNVSAGNLTGTLLTPGQTNITAVGTLGSLNVTTTIGALGNITGGNLSTGGILSVVGNVNAGQNITATGNVSGGNIVTSGLITTSGRIQSTGNINTSSNVVATGNIATSGFFIGDGSLLTNIPGGSYGNANVAAYLPTFTGNLGAGNINLVGTENSFLGAGAGAAATASANTAAARMVAVGYEAGFTGSLSQRGTLVGWRAGYSNVGTDTVAIGSSAGNSAQGTYAVAVGTNAGSNSQGLQAIAIGYGAGRNNQGLSAIAIGASSGNAQGNSSIVIGDSAGEAAVANSIVITTQNITSTGPGLFIDPVRNNVANIGNVVMYNPTTKEITYANTISTAANITGANLVATANLTSTQQTVIGTANVGTTGNIVVSGKNIATDMAWLPDGGNAITGAQGRVVIGTGWNGNITNNALQSRLNTVDAISRANTATAVRQFNAETLVTLNGNVTAGLFRQTGVGTQLRVGGGAAANTIALTNGPGSIFAVSGGQFNVEVGNISPYFLGNTTTSHAVVHGGAVGVAAGSTITNAFGFNTVVNVPTGATTGNITNYTGYSTSITAAVGTGNVFMFYNGNATSASTRSVSVANTARSATNYYAFMNEDDVAQMQLGSVRRYHQFESPTATSGSFAIDKNTAQVHNIVPTGNCTITGYSNMVVSANDGTNNDAQIDTLTIIVEQGATPYTVTLPTGAAFKYANNVSTVGTTANAVTIITVVAANVSGTTTYLSTVSSEFV